MLDIDFLEKESVSLKRNIIYNYDVGIYRTKVFEKIKDYLLSKKISVREVDYNNFEYSLKETSLFGEFVIFIDLVNHPEYKDQKLTTKNRLVIFSKDLSLEECSAIKEIDTSKSNFSKLFNHSFSNSPILSGIKKDQKEKIESSFITWVQENKISLEEFYFNFEYYILSCIDEDKFNISKFKQLTESNKIDYFRLHKLFYDILINASDRSKQKILKYMEEQIKNRVDVKSLINRIFQVICDLCLVNSKLDKAGKDLGFSVYKLNILNSMNSVPVLNLFKTQLLLAKYEGRFNTSNNFLVEFESFISEI